MRRKKKEKFIIRTVKKMGTEKERKEEKDNRWAWIVGRDTE